MTFVQEIELSFFDVSCWEPFFLIIYLSLRFRESFILDVCLTRFLSCLLKDSLIFSSDFLSQKIT